MKAQKRSEHKVAIRSEAKRRIKSAGKYDVATRGDYRDRVEQGLRELRRVSSEGGDPRAKKVKGELMYLLNNYLPQYDARIEYLIEQWRRSGDPSYEPGIRVRFRQARQEHMTKTHAL